MVSLACTHTQSTTPTQTECITYRMSRGVPTQEKSQSLNRTSEDDEDDDEPLLLPLLLGPPRLRFDRPPPELWCDRMSVYEWVHVGCEDHHISTPRTTIPPIAISPHRHLITHSLTPSCPPLLAPPAPLMPPPWPWPTAPPHAPPAAAAPAPPPGARLLRLAPAPPTPASASAAVIVKRNDGVMSLFHLSCPLPSHVHMRTHREEEEAHRSRRRPGQHQGRGARGMWLLLLLSLLLLL